MVAADFNSDTKLDIAVAVKEEKIIFLYNTDNKGGFSHTVLNLDFVPIGLITDRFDADAIPDLATLSVSLNTLPIMNTLHIIHNGGTPIDHYNVGGGELIGLASGDYNRDARKDIAILDKSEKKIRIMKQLLDRTFYATEPAYDIQDVPKTICFADFNGDRYDDIAVGNGNSVSIFFSRANGTLELSQTIN
ncbi:MAG TPA: hypothetical protein PLW02_08695, partial [Verrucomicrobiota bacterium]|nr:hypothetical protein [Verrucomicrobiota bacterium]